MFLKGKSAIVTGSTSGIGLAYAKALAAEGAQVMINGFGDAADIEKERAALEATSGKALYDAADMTKPDEIAAMVKRCHDELGGPDIVIANAGIQHVAKIEDFPPVVQAEASHRTAQQTASSQEERGPMGLIRRLASSLGRHEETQAAQEPVATQQQQRRPLSPEASLYAPRRGQLDDHGRANPQPRSLGEDDQLEIPAFLRRQSN